MKLLIRLLLVGVSLFIALIAVTILLGLPEQSAPLAEATAVNQPVVDGRVTVEVLNAGGVSGMARAATVALRSAGFDVVSFGNASSFDQVESVVVDGSEILIMLFQLHRYLEFVTSAASQIPICILISQCYLVADGYCP